MKLIKSDFIQGVMYQFLKKKKIKISVRSYFNNVCTPIQNHYSGVNY